MSLQFLENSLLNPNVKAFLDMISLSEGAQYNSLFGDTPNGTNVFTDFSKHPNIAVTRNGFTSTAAGRYQILYRVWLPIQKKLNLPDFSEHSQDLYAVNQLSELNVLQQTMDGHFGVALHAAGKIWASLPENSFHQPQHQLQDYIRWYTLSGGSINNDIG